MSLLNAIDDLNEALGRLEGSVDRFGNERPKSPDRNEELQRLNIDRAELAGKLDTAEDRARRLREANREVSRRLIAAMESIRAVTGRA